MMAKLFFTTVYVQSEKEKNLICLLRSSVTNVAHLLGQNADYVISFYFAGCIRATIFAWTFEGHFCFSILGPVSYGAEEVGHAYGPARNSVSRMVSKHCKINVETALEVCFCTCPVARTRSCRSTILGSRIVEMGLYCSYVSVALGCHNFAARAS